MSKICFLFVSLFLSLNARENPFFPIEGEKDITVTSNENMEKAPLKKVPINLPSQARVVQKVTLEYKNLDGSIESKSISIDNKIDWHTPVYLSQNGFKEETVIEENSTKEKVTQKTKNIQEDKSSQFTEIASTPFIRFLSSKNKIQILTKHKLLRDFILVNPHRVVLDFESDVDVKNYTIKGTKIIVQEIRIGNHKGYFRAVIELDGKYRYKKSEISGGYEFKLL